MKPAFRDLAPDGPRVILRIDGHDMAMRDGANLAAEMLAAGIMPFRQTPVSGAPRGPFCMMGACFDCLVEIEGTTRQACLMEVTAGLDITLPKGRRDA
ncbi:(2Fe-2S)-binding protein [Aliigemmobacter aestuarii]|uniref:(2Fe-2S)-binding protein n=1 Tax=Aliigemmobacter aestuarii TaxID=1445661 RepID=A0A4S3MJL4_9RHOB|nr:(2Fe-2S)-binding protein [Gemmobacter aestuarii]THD81458.1 (2Fe-2S)-binding protein [Gemmobacter aestuarii]